MPSMLPPTRCALTAPFHPYQHRDRCFGGLLSVALSVGSRPPGITWHPARRARTFLHVPADEAQRLSGRLSAAAPYWLRPATQSDSPGSADSPPPPGCRAAAAARVRRPTLRRTPVSCAAIAAARGAGSSGSNSCSARPSSAARRTVRPRRAVDQQRNLAAHEIASARASAPAAERSTIDGLVELGQLACDHGPAALAEIGARSARVSAIRWGPRRARACAFRWQGAPGIRAVPARVPAGSLRTRNGRWEPGNAQRGSHRRRPRHRAHLDPGGGRCTHQRKSGVGQQRRAGIADQGDHFALRSCAPGRRPSILVVFVQRDQPAGYADRRQQLAGAPRILGRHRSAWRAILARAGAQVAEIADRGRDDVSLGGWERRPEPL